jgi:nitroreductase
MTTLNDHMEKSGNARADIIKNLNWRYATKKFDAKRHLSADDLATLKNVLHLAPSSFGLQPWKFFVIGDPDVRKKLQPAAFNQPQIVEASHLVVLAARKGLSAADVERHIGRIATTRGTSVESLQEIKQRMLGFVTGMPPEFIDAWAARQVYIALGVLLTSAAMLGIDACPMEGFEPPKFDEILGLGSHGYTAVVLCALGYRSAEDHYAKAPKVRHPAHEVIVHV